MKRSRQTLRVTELHINAFRRHQAIYAAQGVELSISQTANVLIRELLNLPPQKLRSQRVEVRSISGELHRRFIEKLKKVLD